MNYGFPPTKFDKELALRLEALCLTLPKDSHGMSPYIERDGLYQGVRIRRITHYNDSFRQEIVDEAERIYKDVEVNHVKDLNQ